ncbi:hypothetical protein K388_07170 [Streptomyces sp. KhCrAH-43]|uniref:hypothetical protein n=1 Tax=unclassified Streptomyces TaxID=2593676 RepID=UPI000381C22C|nr:MULTISPECIES: hypothetical protein [unclassified Streptomyces]MYS36372.1 hypothetical protein [Streptomyces sp. SID4920]MYX63935.1 hypothetical protein [Streptomyces sp. SID8373]RAJ47789.1 hypothetical protein K388_07170 [Streptomyces sp. KhCrAH-43]
MPKSDKNRRRKSHAERQRIKAKKAASGASYTSAQSGTVHCHRGPEIGPVDGTGFGVDRQADMETASALIGACLEACRPCQASLADKVLAGDRLVVASLAGTVHSLLPSPDVVCSPATRKFHAVAHDAVRPGYGPAVLAAVEELTVEDLEALLEDTLDLWAAAAGPAPSSSAAGDGTPAGEQEQEPRRFDVAGGTAYLLCAGIDQLLDREEMQALIQHAEKSAAAGDAVECFLCDQPLDVTAEPEIHLGVAMRTLTLDGQELDTVQPVFTHPGCGRTRVWPWAELMAERQRRGLEVAAEDRQPERPAGQQHPRNADYTTFSLARRPDGGGIVPLVLVEPGEPDAYGAEGWLAARLSEGFKPVDLSGQEPFPKLNGWSLRCDRGRLVSVMTASTGAWYRQEGGYETPGEWRKAARQRSALLLVVPSGSVGERQGDQWLEAVSRAAGAGHLLGGLVAVRGTLS